MITTIKEAIRRIVEGESGRLPSDEAGRGGQLVSAAANQPSETPSAAIRPPWELYLLVGTMIGQCALVLLGNVPHISIWLLALLAIGVGQALLLPASGGWFGSLLIVVLWILFRQTTGLWLAAEWTQNLVEISGLVLSLILTLRYRTLWDRQQQAVQEWQSLRQLFYTGEVGTGLLPRSVAELRLLEEIERTNTSRRPLGLLLVELEPVKSGAATDFRECYRAISRQLVGAALIHDIPFRVNSKRLGLILLEREWEKLFLDTDLIIESLKNVSCLDDQGHARPLLRDVTVHVGLGTYAGTAESKVDLLGAAEASLEKGRKLAGVDSPRIASYTVAAAPIVEARLVLWNGNR